MTRFFNSMGLLLLLTAGVKIISSFGHAHILQMADPILGISYMSLFRTVGMAELTVAVICFVSDSIKLKACLTAWLATGFLIYRLGLAWSGYHKPCPCLGNLVEVMGIRPGSADIGMKVALAYLLIGSYSTLFWLWRVHKRELACAPL